MKIKVSSLTGVALDWAVAQLVYGPNAKWVVHTKLGLFYSSPGGRVEILQYSSDWGDGGPIIEREKIRLDPRESEWKAQCWVDSEVESYGPTPLIAAMRCYVSSKFGEEIDIP